MKRTILGIATIAALGMTLPSSAADYSNFPELRPAYPESWETSDANPLRFEAGVRYWYSMGHQEHNIGTASQTMDTKTSSGEVFARVEDPSTQTFAEAFGGYGISHGGTYSNNGGASNDLLAARLGYVGADYGWLPWGNESGGFGFITGYQYTNDSPDTGRASFRVSPTVVDNGGGIYSIGGGGDSKINNFEIHSLKLGLAGKADFGGFDVQGEAAAIPYSWITGTYGAFAIPGQTSAFQQASATQINGHAYGATGKVMVGFHPTENLTIRVGGRATYLSGQYDTTYDAVRLVPNGVNPPTLATQRYISNNNPFNMIRYGALFELSGRF
ncbi:MAG: hypothetical protein JWQ22_1851 [Devosia sp.]|nr:hypothetical protein [Devosia sp.]